MNRDLRWMMARFPTGVTIVTALADDGMPWGMTVSSVCSVTLTPPTLLVCLRSGSPTLTAVEQAGGFAVNLLHHGAQAVAELFASGAPDRFDRVEWTLPAGAGGPHLAQAANAIGDCRLTAVERVGDHSVLFGEVERVSEHRSRVPLIYGFRRFAAWSAGSAP